MTKRCSRCLMVLGLDCFNKASKELDGLQYQCKKCHIAARKPGRRKPRSYDTDRKHRLKRYGLTIEEYQSLSDSQDGRCAICEFKVFDNPLIVDHCHITKKIRGLLCNKCNIAIGLLRDDPQLVRSALIYLERFQIS